MYAFSLADQTPVVSFFGLAMQKPGIPGKRSGNGTPVNKINHEGVICHGDILYGRRSYLKRQNSRHG